MSFTLLERLPALAGSTLTVILLRYLLHSLVFKPFGSWALRRSKGIKSSSPLPLPLQHRCKKLTESLWKATAYACLMILGVRALYGKAWAFNSIQWWEGHPTHHLEQEVKQYYNAELAFYSGSLAMLLFWEERRHDFLVMLAHHIVTVVLVSFSFQAGFGRVGSVVMVLHDPSDVCLELAKILQYLDFEGLAMIFFTMLLLSWGILRLLVLPFWLIKSSIKELPESLGGYPGYSRAFIGMLCILVCMHVYWFALILRIAWTAVVTGDKRDTREDED